jgi:integrase
MRAQPNKRKLNKLTVKRQTTAGVIWDVTQRGLVLRVRPSGARSWYCVYSRAGRPRWMHLGAADAIGLADARLMAGEAMLQVARGKDPAAERRAERGQGTFEELAARYVEQYAKRKNKSWKQADALVRHHLIPTWGKLQAGSIARSDVKAMMARLQDKPIAGNQTLAAASAIFSWAIKEEILIGINPCRDIDRNTTTDRERVLADSEIPKFWAAFDGVGLAGVALKMILLTGQRPGEVTGMRREHIRDGWWELPGAPVPALKWLGTKNSESHRIWLPAPVLELLADLPDDDGAVFPGLWRRLDQPMRDICKTLGVARATPHDLRRTHGTTITAMGFGRDGMNRIQNHKEGGIGSVYDRHQYSDENRRIMEVVAAHIVGLAEGRPGPSVIPFNRKQLGS